MSTLPTVAVAIPSLGGIPIRNTRDLINPDSRICAMVLAPPKRGKTTFAATLDAMTQKYMGKRTIIIALEAAEGGGTMSIAEQGIPYVQPGSLDEYKKIIAALASDTTYGGIVLDSGSELVQRFMKPMALKMPVRGTPPPSRAAGVPVRDDYQVMGEFGRIEFNKLINLTTVGDLNIRKHLIVTAIEKEFFDDDGTLRSIKTDLPGQLKDSITAMFQTVGRLMIRTEVVPDPANPARKLRLQRRVFSTRNDGIADIGDRTHVFPDEGPVDFVELWEKYWVPRFERATA